MVGKRRNEWSLILGTSGRFHRNAHQACILNFNYYIKALFGNRQGLDENLTYSLQFLELTEQQFATSDIASAVPRPVLSYINDFDTTLSHEQYNSPRFSYRLIFKKKLVNRPGQADCVIEFIDPNSELAKAIDKEYWVKKEVERPKFRAKDVVAAVREGGFPKFGVWGGHLEFRKAEDAKNPAKGYGTDVQGTWYWYENWVKRCLELCEQAGDKYR